MAPEERARIPFLSLLGRLASMIGGVLVVVFVGAVVLTARKAPDFLIVCVLEISFLMIAFLSGVVGSLRSPRDFTSHHAKATIFALLTGVAVFLFTGTTLARFYSADYVQHVAQMMDRAREYLGMTGLLVVFGVLAPFAEECFFRGAVLQTLLRYFHPAAAVTLAAVCFGLFHPHPIHMPISIILGLVCGAACITTGSLWIAVAIHATNNLVGLASEGLFPDSVSLPLWNVPVSLAIALAGLAILRTSRFHHQRPGNPVNPRNFRDTGRCLRGPPRSPGRRPLAGVL